MCHTCTYTAFNVCLQRCTQLSSGLGASEEAVRRGEALLHKQSAALVEQETALHAKTEEVKTLRRERDEATTRCVQFHVQSKCKYDA
jgi:hypothetical protein